MKSDLRRNPGCMKLDERAGEKVPAKKDKVSRGQKNPSGALAPEGFCAVVSEERSDPGHAGLTGGLGHSLGHCVLHAGVKGGGDDILGGKLVLAD